MYVIRLRDVPTKNGNWARIPYLEDMALRQCLSLSTLWIGKKDPETGKFVECYAGGTAVNRSTPKSAKQRRSRWHKPDPALEQKGTDDNPFGDRIIDGSTSEVFDRIAKMALANTDLGKESGIVPEPKRFLIYSTDEQMVNLLGKESDLLINSGHEGLEVIVRRPHRYDLCTRYKEFWLKGTDRNGESSVFSVTYTEGGPVLKMVTGKYGDPGLEVTPEECEKAFRTLHLIDPKTVPVSMETGISNYAVIVPEFIRLGAPGHKMTVAELKTYVSNVLGKKAHTQSDLADIFEDLYKQAEPNLEKLFGGMRAVILMPYPSETQENKTVAHIQNVADCFPQIDCKRQVGRFIVETLFRIFVLMHKVSGTIYDPARSTPVHTVNGLMKAFIASDGGSLSLHARMALLYFRPIDIQWIKNNSPKATNVLYDLDVESMFS